MLVDHHCHIDRPEFASDLDGVVARAHAAGVGVMVKFRRASAGLTRCKP